MESRRGRKSPGINGFHNSPNGPEPCNATVRSCKYGEHFKTYEQAEARYEEVEARLNEESGAARGLSKKPAPPAALRVPDDAESGADDEALPEIEMPDRSPYGYGGRPAAPAARPRAAGGGSYRSAARDGKPIRRRELDHAAAIVNGNISEEDWRNIQAATDDLYVMVRETGQGRVPKERIRNIKSQVVAALKSDDPSMKAYRAYMGRDVDVSDLADLIVLAPKTLYSPSKIDENSPARNLMTRTGNDMNHKRVIATVMYFAGRCCYCGRPLKKGRAGSKAPDTATVDHLDPIAPQSFNEIPGETKFGNVALCCYACNKAKGNTSLGRYIASDNGMSKEEKVASIDRLMKFREYTMYQPMSKAQAKMTARCVRGLWAAQDKWAEEDRMRGSPPDEQTKRRRARAMESMVRKDAQQIRELGLSA